MRLKDKPQSNSTKDTTTSKEELLAYINYLKSLFRMHGIHIDDRKFTI